MRPAAFSSANVMRLLLPSSSLFELLPDAALHDEADTGVNTSQESATLSLFYDRMYASSFVSTTLEERVRRRSLTCHSVQLPSERLQPHAPHQEPLFQLRVASREFPHIPS